MASKEKEKKPAGTTGANAPPINIGDDTTLDALPLGKKYTRTITVKAEELKPDEPPPVFEEHSETDSDDLDGEQFFGDDLTDNFFDDDLGVEFVEVYRIVGGSLRGGGKMPFIDNFPFSATIRADIREGCGGGTFVVLQRGTDPVSGRAGILRRKEIVIEGPPKEYNPQSAPQSQSQSTSAPVVAPATDDGLDTFLTRMSKFGETMKLFGMGKQQPVATTAPALVPEPHDAGAEIAKTVELYKQITSVANAAGSNGGGWAEGAARLIEALGEGLGLKAIVPMVINAAILADKRKQQGAQQPSPDHSAPREMSPGPDAVGSTEEPFAPDASQPPTPDQMLMGTFLFVIQSLRRGKRPGGSADAIDELLVKCPEFQPQLQEMLDATDIDILGQLSLIAREDLSTYNGALAFIAGLKESLQIEFIDVDAVDTVIEGEQ